MTHFSATSDQDFYRWIEQTKLGQHLKSCEMDFFAKHFEDSFGRYACQLGLSEWPILEESRVPFKLYLGRHKNATIQSDMVALPLRHRSVDLMVLAHTLDFHKNPHQVLREAKHALLPEGKLILTGFNPYSTWGLRRFLQDHSVMPWGANYLSLARIKDWFALLGLEVIDSQYMNCVLPLEHAATIERCELLKKMPTLSPCFGGVYGIVAIKKVARMTLLKPNWQPASYVNRALWLQPKSEQSSAQIPKDHPHKVQESKKPFD